MILLFSNNHLCSYNIGEDKFFRSHFIFNDLSVLNGWMDGPDRTDKVNVNFASHLLRLTCCMVKPSNAPLYEHEHEGTSS